MSRFESFQTPSGEMPESHLAWPLYGAGFDHVGRDGKPVEMPLRPLRDDEILVRNDAVGICFSDIKVINQGGNHARLRGRDLASDPTILGHECSVTVVRAGARWAEQFKPGDRYIVQADIYFEGVNYAFGYMLSGGQAGYAYLDGRALAGDEGCYLIPVADGIGYSQAALVEPWACVEMSYACPPRTEPGDQAGMLLVADEESPLAARFPMARRVGRDLQGVGSEQYTDILLEGGDASLAECLAPRLAPHGNLFVIAPKDSDGDVEIDIGAIHYQDLRILGGGDTLEEVAAAHGRCDLMPGGAALILGGGGPIGQMHVQRALELPQPPATIVVTGLTRTRLDHIDRNLGPRAAALGVGLHTVARASHADEASFRAAIRACAPKGYSDAVVMAPAVSLVEDAFAFAADGAVINVFAGLVIGTRVRVPFSAFCRGVTVIGTSGSRIADMRSVLDKVEAGALDTNQSVAAVGGLEAAKDGLLATRDATYPGKTIIYPQIHGLPLMDLGTLAEQYPEIGAKYSPEGGWTLAAERALLERFL